MGHIGPPFGRVDSGKISHRGCPVVTPKDSGMSGTTKAAVVVVGGGGAGLAAADETARMERERSSA